MHGGSRTHDYTIRAWGHDFVISRVSDGMLFAYGWGEGIMPGDFLILPNRDATTRYKVDTIKYQDYAPDMWSAKLRFAPR